MKTIGWFHSKSPEDWKKWLSNFAVYDPTGFYPSVEAQFQAMKFCYSNHPEHRLLIDWKNLSSKESKRIGSKSYFKQHGIQLDIEKWNKDRIPLMTELLRIRYKKDKNFRSILKRCKKENIDLYHYSLRDQFWGAYQRKKDGVIVGNNHLGKILNKLS
jgi:predicted NAD-dependent protein-ADP-ribosyltransferase YbiA (DUF1768 family)